MKSVDLDRHVWEGWRVRDFISDLEIAVRNIMEGKSWRPPFQNRNELKIKYGLNSSVEICHVCGKEMDIVLFGTSYKDENGESAEAPPKICLGNICDDCKKVIEDGGIFFVEVRDGERGDNPYRTGRVCAVKEEAVKRVFTSYGKLNYLEHSAWEQVFGK